MHVRAGFRAILRQPALALAEIVWRWAFGAAAWLLLGLTLRRILAGVDVSGAELLIARRSDLFTIADACARVLVQVLPRLARACRVLVPAVAAIWIVAATVGRAATLKALLSSTERARWGALAALHGLRALCMIAALAAFLGAMLLAGMAMPALSPTAAAVAWMALAVGVILSWSIMNWFLALAPIWIVRDCRPVFGSIGASLELWRRSPSAYCGIASWFGALRGLAFLAAFIAALVAAQASAAQATALCVVIALVYFAIADFLCLARLAAYIALDESTQLPAVRDEPGKLVRSEP